MKINLISYLISIGYSAPSDPLADTVKYRTMIDGTISPLKYGARKERIAEFSIINLTKAQYIALVNYFVSQAGNKIKMTPENSGESIFPEFPYGGITDYWVYLLEPKELQEEDFTVTNGLYKIKVTAALAGVDNSGAVPNDADSSTVDIVIEIDTTLAAHKQISTPGNGSYVGERWLNTGDNKLYEWDGTDWTTLLYQVHNDEKDAYGFEGGTFYLSAFADLTVSGQDYKSGIINFEGAKLPGQSIDINKGPAIARRDGYSFALANIKNSPSVEMFWAFVVDNKINLYGAKCTLKVYYSGSLYTQLTGINITNSFSYTDYVFQVEPFILNRSGKFPTTTIEDDPDLIGEDYDDVIESTIGKPPFITYGQHDKAMLQNISVYKILYGLQRRLPNAYSTKIMYAFTMYIKTTDKGILKLRNVADIDENSYETPQSFLDDIDNNDLMVKISKDSNSATDDRNVGEVRKIESYSQSGGYLELTLNSDLIVAGTSSSYVIVAILKSKFRYQIDENVCEGFGSLNSQNNFVLNYLNLYNIDENGRDFNLIPRTQYSQDANGNIIKLNPEIAGGGNNIENYNALKIDQSFISGTLGQGLDETGTLADESSSPLTYDFTDSIPQPAGFGGYWVRVLKDEIIYGVYNTDNIIIQSLWQAYVSNIELPILDAGTRSCDFHIDYTFEIESNLSNIIFVQSENSLYRYLIRFQEGNITGYDNTKMLKAGTVVAAYRMMIYHGLNEGEISSNEKVKLGMQLDIHSLIETRPLNNDSGDIYSRSSNAGIKLIVRFITYAGNVITNVDWEHQINEAELGLAIATTGDLGRIQFDNIPNSYDADDATFSENNTTLKTNYDYLVKFAQNAQPTGAIKGDKWLETDQNPMVIRKYDGSSWDVGTAFTPDDDGKLIYKMHSWGNEDAALYKYQWSDNSLQTPTEGLDYTLSPVMSGRDLFDISEFFGDAPTYPWGDVESMELLIVNENVDRDWALDPYYNYLRMYYRYWSLSVELKGLSPQLFTIEETSLEDKPLFSAVKGRSSGGTMYEDPSAIIKNIMSQLYPRQYNETSIDDLLPANTGSRGSWVWRRQFTKAMSDIDTLKEILWNLWAVAVINEDDEIEFKPLEFADDKAVFAFTDSNIIKDSISKVQFRKANEIKQRFIINYDYNIASEVSKAMPEYNKAVEHNSDNNSKINNSKTLFNLMADESTSTFEYGLKYHYEKLTNIDQWIVDHFAFNAWAFKFKAKIETTLLIATPLKIMDVVSVTSYFHTDQTKVKGFITSIKPDIYNGVVEYGVFVPEPPGKYGALCDPFKDALNLNDRDITDWSGDGRINDGQQVSTRGVITETDAGQVSTRTFCN